MYANARKQDGSFYSKNTLSAIRYGVARYIQAERNIDIVSDSEFSSSNEAFLAAVAERKSLGKGKVNHYPEITSENLEKLYASFDISTPKELQKKCLFDIIYFLVRRGCKNLRNHTKSSFAVDSQTRKYVYQDVDELDKNHRENDDPSETVSDAQMYEMPGNSFVPREII